MITGVVTPSSGKIEINGKTVIFLNPGGFYIQKFFEPRDDIKFYIYVICSDKEVANRIEKANIKQEIKNFIMESIAQII